MGYSSIIDGARSAGTATPLEYGRARANIGNGLAPFFARIEEGDVRFHLLKRRVEAVRVGFTSTPSTVTSEPGTSTAAA